MSQPISSQKPAEGITAFKQYPDMKFFRVSCECSCDNKIDLYVEADDCAITVGFDTEVVSPHWNELWKITYDEAWPLMSFKALVNAIHHRASVCWEVITKGYVKSSVHVLLTEQQALNFSQVLVTSIDELKKNKETNASKATNIQN